MFMQCSKKVAEKNEQDPTKGTTVILNELLADEVWLAEVSIAPIPHPLNDEGVGNHFLISYVFFHHKL